MKLFLKFILVLGIAASAGLALAQYDSRVTVYNQSAYAIYHLQMTAAGSRGWGPDLLGGHVLYPGQQYSIAVTCGVYHVRLVDEDGGNCVVPNVAICLEDSAWGITSDDLDRCAGFGY